MICKEIKELLPGFIEGSLSRDKHEAVAEHLQSCKVCTDDMDKLINIDEMLSKVVEEETPEKVNSLFREQLEIEKLKTKINLSERIGQKHIPLAIILRVAAGILLLVTGGFIGYFMRSQPESSNEVSSLKQEMVEMKNLVIYSLLKQESASERIKAVSYIKEISEPEPKLIETLFNALNNDRNVNVRLAAAQALARFKDDKEVAKQIVKSLEKQTEPLVQIMLINLAVETGGNDVAPELTKLLQRPDLMDEVKSYAKKGIKTLSI